MMMVFFLKQLLTETDWLILKGILGGLEIFNHATEQLHGKAKKAVYGLVWKLILIFETLMLALKDLSLIYPNEVTFGSNHPLPECGQFESIEFMNAALDAAFAKLKKYYDLTDCPFNYVAASVLNPMLKWRYLEYTWREEPRWIFEGQQKVCKLCNIYKATSISVSKPPSPPPQRENRLDDELYSWQHYKPPRVTDGYETYCVEPPLQRMAEPDLIVMCRGLEPRFPTLAAMAYDILSIPAMSAECERVFSSAKLLLSDSRNSLSPESVEGVECNRNWILNGYGLK
jgi:hAT family C-terminal dimerisation region